MASGNRGLGKGLGALLGDAAMQTEATESLNLPISQIENCASQPRKVFDKESLSDLADSIREHGIIQPLTVRKLSSGYYQIIAGERRWRAARIAGLKQVPAIVIEADDRKAMELALIENLQREDLNPLEEAEGYRTLIENYSMTQEQAAESVGKSRSTVTNALRLLSLCADVRNMLEQGQITSGHARAILTLSEPQQLEAANTIILQGLNVRQTEALVKKMNEKRPEKPAPDPIKALNDSYGEIAAHQLGERLGRSVKIVNGKRKGRIELEYYGTDDLNDLLDALGRLESRKGTAQK